MADTQPPAASVPPKPIRSKQWALITLCAVAGLYTLIVLLQSGKPTQKPKQDQASANAAPSNTDTGQNFNDQLQREANDLLAKRQAMKEVQPNFTSLADVVSHLPACDDAERMKLRGQYYVAMGPDNQVLRLACDTNNVWTPVPDGAGEIQPMTPQQQNAAQAAYKGGGGESGTESKAQKLAQARQAALDSTSVALDYSASKQEKHDASTNEAMPGKLVPVALESEKPSAYPWDTFTGPLYHLFEGDVIETILTNRLAGEFSGPVNVMVTTNLYSRDRQHILIPQGTRILGEATKVSMTGQRRLAVVFHRVLMPDGFSVGP